MGLDLGPLDHTFTASIGVELKGVTWGAVEMQGSVDMFGTGLAVRVDVTVDDVVMRSVELLPTGRGTHMLSLDPRFRAKIGKDLGDDVTVKIVHRHA